VAQNDRLDAAISGWTGTRSLNEVLASLEKAEVPCGRVYTVADMFSDPHYRAREMIQRSTLPDGQPINLPGIVPKLSDTPGQTRWVGPELGAHTREVLSSLGIEGCEFERLRAKGIL
jgi:formyl-CoA transferase